MKENCDIWRQVWIPLGAHQLVKSRSNMCIPLIRHTCKKWRGKPLITVFMALHTQHACVLTLDVWPGGSGFFRSGIGSSVVMLKKNKLKNKGGHEEVREDIQRSKKNKERRAERKGGRKTKIRYFGSWSSATCWRSYFQRNSKNRQWVRRYMQWNKIHLVSWSAISYGSKILTQWLHIWPFIVWFLSPSTRFVRKCLQTGHDSFFPPSMSRQPTIKGDINCHIVTQGTRNRTQYLSSMQLLDASVTS